MGWLSFTCRPAILHFMLRSTEVLLRKVCRNFKHFWEERAGVGGGGVFYSQRLHITDIKKDEQETAKNKRIQRRIYKRSDQPKNWKTMFILCFSGNLTILRNRSSFWYLCSSYHFLTFSTVAWYRWQILVYLAWYLHVWKTRYLLEMRWCLEPWKAYSHKII